MKFSVDPWEGDFAPTSDPNDNDLGEGVDVDVEVTAADWGAINSAAAAEPYRRVVFIDGVQSSDALLGIYGADGLMHTALAATWVCGAVLCTPDGADLLAPPTVTRAVFSDYDQLQPVVIGGVTWAARPGQAGDPPDLGNRLRSARRASEKAVGQTVPRDPATLTVFDGTMHAFGRTRHTPWGVGMAKRAHARYLPKPLHQTISTLPCGHRSPLFKLPDGRLSWYASIADPETPLITAQSAGVVRVETETIAGADIAVIAEFADRVTATLPPFASKPWEDSRAPTNLRPIRGLENAMKGLLGDRQLLRQLLANAAAVSASVAP